VWAPERPAHCWHPHLCASQAVGAHGLTGVRCAKCSLDVCLIDSVGPLGEWVSISRAYRTSYTLKVPARPSQVKEHGEVGSLCRRLIDRPTAGIPTCALNKPLVPMI
jgi:hypothetical protein